MSSKHARFMAWQLRAQADALEGIDPQLAFRTRLDAGEVLLASDQYELNEREQQGRWLLEQQLWAGLMAGRE